MAALWLETNLPPPPLSDITLATEGSRRRLMLDSPPLSKRQCHDETGLPASRPLLRFHRMHRHDMSPRLREAERILMVDFTSTQA
jgi:hypothetical protein